jgi:hypothetical protein
MGDLSVLFIAFAQQGISPRCKTHFDSMSTLTIFYSLVGSPAHAMLRPHFILFVLSYLNLDFTVCILLTVSCGDIGFNEKNMSSIGQVTQPAADYNGRLAGFFKNVNLLRKSQSYSSGHCRLCNCLLPCFYLNLNQP